MRWPSRSPGRITLNLSVFLELTNLEFPELEKLLRPVCPGVEVIPREKVQTRDACFFILAQPGHCRRNLSFPTHPCNFYPMMFNYTNSSTLQRQNIISGYTVLFNVQSLGLTLAKLRAFVTSENNPSKKEDCSMVLSKALYLKSHDLLKVTRKAGVSLWNLGTV